MYYFDYTASGRLYRPIENKLTNVFGPLVGNTHSESNETGTIMTLAYNYAKNIIKKHVNASTDDILIPVGYGMTAGINKLQRLLGLRYYNLYFNDINEKPIVFVTHMEHHSNHISWLETVADVVCLQPGKNCLVDLDILENELKKHKNRKYKIGSFTACSNVTGIQTPYHKMAELMHLYNGICFVDFAASAPYIEIDMHPSNPYQQLDGILFSPHKFLGGPGSSGILIFNSNLYNNKVPDCPGGGTVDWTNPWGGRKYVNDIELREDGGTPGFLQTIKAALCIELKEKMKIENIYKRERELLKIFFDEVNKIDKVHILLGNVTERLGIVSLYTENIHYNLLVKILNDRFGIQVRGGCSCAGTYGHYLLHIDREESKFITDYINKGDFSYKPGWVRFSLHPIMRDDEIHYAAYAIRESIKNVDKWKRDYEYDPHSNQFYNIREKNLKFSKVYDMFKL